MANDEAGGRNEEVVHPVKTPADRLRVHGVVGHVSAGLIDHLVNSDGEEGEFDEYAQCCPFLFIQRSLFPNTG